MRYETILPDPNRGTPQRRPIRGREHEMERNLAGGYLFKADDWLMLRKFLILGSASNTYYATRTTLTKQSLTNVEKLLRSGNGVEVVNEIVDVSVRGLAPTNDHALLALAYVSVNGDSRGRKAAYEALPKVARIGTHLFTFLEYRKRLGGGWGRGIRNAVGNWYNGKTPKDLEYQLVKYRQREGWTHADALRLSHPVPVSPSHNVMYSWATGKYDSSENDLPLQIGAYEALKDGMPLENAVNLVRNLRLPREVIPTELLNEAVIWDALLDDMPVGALIRNLNKLTATGVVSSLGGRTKDVTAKLRDPDAIKWSRVHPLQILLAYSAYTEGSGRHLSWTPVPAISKALMDAFCLSFDNVEPTGKRIVVAVDKSGSMGGTLDNFTAFSTTEVAAAMAMSVLRSEEWYQMVAFDTSAFTVNVTDTDTLASVTRKFRGSGGTDVASPIRLLSQNKIIADAIIIYTDEMTWSGRRHPCEEMKNYRSRFNKDARLVIVSLVNYPGRVSDPNDPLSLQVVGLDSSAPQIIRNFISGEF